MAGLALWVSFASGWKWIIWYTFMLKNRNVGWEEQFRRHVPILCLEYNLKMPRPQGTRGRSQAAPLHSGVGENPEVLDCKWLSRAWGTKRRRVQNTCPVIPGHSWSENASGPGGQFTLFCILWLKRNKRDNHFHFYSWHIFLSYSLSTGSDLLGNETVKMRN